MTHEHGVTVSGTQTTDIQISSACQSLAVE